MGCQLRTLTGRLDSHTFSRWSIEQIQPAASTAAGKHRRETEEVCSPVLSPCVCVCVFVSRGRRFSRGFAAESPDRKLLNQAEQCSCQSKWVTSQPGVRRGIALHLSMSQTNKKPAGLSVLPEHFPRTGPRFQGKAVIGDLKRHPMLTHRILIGAIKAIFLMISIKYKQPDRFPVLCFLFLSSYFTLSDASCQTRGTVLFFWNTGTQLQWEFIIYFILK